MIKILLLGDKVRRKYAAPLAEALEAQGIAAHLGPDIAPEAADYVVLQPDAAPADFGPFTRAKAVLSVWMGVETLVSNPTLVQPLARMVEPAMTQGMTEYVVAHVMRHHVGLDRYVHGLKGEWDKALPPLAPERPVTVLGLGELGRAAAQALAALGFPVTGWSRSPRDLPCLTRAFSGADGLHPALADAQIIVVLLPQTADTTNLLGAAEFAQTAPGAVIINPARGPIIDDTALLAALDSGQIGHATLDVFREEPLPPAHPFWHHPRVTVTPHIAAETRPASAALTLAENIAGVERGEPLSGRVDVVAGY